MSVFVVGLLLERLAFDFCFAAAIHGGRGGDRDNDETEPNCREGEKKRVADEPADLEMLVFHTGMLIRLEISGQYAGWKRDFQKAASSTEPTPAHYALQ
ncbi:hypothetical protein HFO56_01510 [Rhizobium laguerreae]|uniref:hypothetical protein n=1 Tax=Rhizobium laguerreae TaxID=1076926 RepID=UPI001C91FA61|nr:hypothetical protein [Rhizobium laguerreae]MBY3151087.1 hypothetical protein [Rhizobium laguerreae]